jgi:hypothetical protein
MSEWNRRRAEASWARQRAKPATRAHVIPLPQKVGLVVGVMSDVDEAIKSEWLSDFSGGGEGDRPERERVVARAA